MKTSNLTGPALDWAVAKAEGPDSVAACYYDDDTPLYLDEAPQQEWHPSTDWAQGGPIIERECIFIAPTWDGVTAGSSARASRTAWIEGPTPLIAAMRCYVASKLGDEVEIPEGLR